jgi:hypothetical protein
MRQKRFCTRAICVLFLLASNFLAADDSTFAYDRNLALEVREHEVASAWPS